MTIILPSISLTNSRPLRQVIENRRSIREFSETAINLEELSLLLWSAQGSTGSNKQRSAPSAGGQYPIDIYVAVSNVASLTSATYKYNSLDHQLDLVIAQEIKPDLNDAAIGEQKWLNDAAVIIILAANFFSMREHFYDQPPMGERANQYIYMESGAITQNIHLQATDLDLAGVLVGGFDDDKVARLLELSEGIRPSALMCIGAKNE